MVEKIKKELLERLQKTQDNLRANKELGLKHLEELGEEMSSAFNKAKSSLDFKINIFEELKKNRPKLKLWKISWLKTIFPINLVYLFSMPFIYGMIIPGLIFHTGLEIYHQICFRLYGIPLVKPGDYFIYDRHLLPYLNWFEKLNCIYCSYFNNLLRYATEISGRTERYWCPIKYAHRVNNTHSQYPKFVGYLDAQDFREKWEGLRDFSDLEPEKEKCDFKK